MKKIMSLFLATIVFCVSTTAFADTITVRKGDSMWSIAKRYNVSFAKVLELNKNYKNQHLICPNDKIIIPTGSEGTKTVQNSANDTVAEGNNTAPLQGISTMAEAVLLLVNQERTKQGLKELFLSDDITDIATLKSQDMANKGYFSHTSPTYGTPFQMLQSYGISYKSAGENIAAGQKTAQEVMQSWMNSSGHRANILNSGYTEIGIGYYVGGSYGTYWTQLFVGE